MTIKIERLSGAAGDIGWITLDAEKSLNALTLEMIRSLSRTLTAWQADPTLRCVVMNGAGEKAFCAGGDVVALYHAMVDKDPGAIGLGDAFFEEEYALDVMIHTYPKPILCWGHGIVMGGGLGLMAGASHRVVTEKSRIAMPEITIGLYPDVGGSWFLSRMPGRVGLYLGLTGASLNGADALFLGLADFALPAVQKSDLRQALSALNWSNEDARNHAILSGYLRKSSAGFAQTLASSPVREHFDLIQALTDADSVEEVVAKITAYTGDDAWVSTGAQKLKIGSPSSAAIIFEIHKRVKHLSLKEVFAFELNLSRQFLRHPDFREGVRALLIDKDNSPKWNPALISDVNKQWTDSFFELI